MYTENSDLKRKHTEPYFWKYAVVYIVMGAGFLLWLGEAIAMVWPRSPGVGIVAMLLGLLGWLGIENRRLKDRIDVLEKRVEEFSNQ